jgi:hypothetical protein
VLVSYTRLQKQQKKERKVKEKTAANCGMPISIPTKRSRGGASEQLTSAWWQKV